MNGIRPTVGIEFDDEYVEAANRVIDLAKAMEILTPEQKSQLIIDSITAMSMATSLEQFINNMKNRGKA